MSPQPCEHGVPFARLPDGSVPQCDACDLIWEESCIRMAQESLVAHTAKRDALLVRLGREAASPEGGPTGPPDEPNPPDMNRMVES